MIFKTKFLEEYVNFVDTTKKQKKNFERNLTLNAFILFLFFYFFSYLNI